MEKRERSEAQREAERRYRESRKQVLLRFTPKELAQIKKASGGDSAAWIKARALEAANPDPRQQSSAPALLFAFVCAICGPII